MLFTILLHSSCKKQITEKDIPINPSEAIALERNPDTNCDLSANICEDFFFQEQTGEDEDDLRPTVLGGIYNNPYSIANMTAAYNYIYSSNISSIVTTHKYVRFKPNSVSQLGILDSLDIEFYDYPLNQHVIQDGDYWPEAGYSLSQGEFPWFYTVVDLWFNFPPGIQIEILEQLHIPDVNADLEDEAFYITGNSVCDSAGYANRREEIKDYYTSIPNNYIPCVLQRSAENPIAKCGGGGGGGGTQPTPRPAGMLSFKTYTTSLGGRSSEMITEGIGASAPLKYARVVGRRFFKIDKTYTDQNGNFQFSKRFPRKVTLIVKFKASTGYGQHSVRMNHTNLGFWRSMFPMKKNIGTYKGNNLQNLNYQFEKGSTSSKRKTRLWLGAVIMNTTQETKLFLNENGMISLPQDLRLYLNTPGEQVINEPQYDFLRRSNVPYLNQDRSLLLDIVRYLAAAATIIVGGSYFTPMILGTLSDIQLSQRSAGQATIVGLGTIAISLSLIPHYPDVEFYYKTSDINSITATKVSICAAQQMGLIYLYNLYSQNPTVRQDRSSYIQSRQYAINNFRFTDFAPFGNGIPVSNIYNNYNPGLIGIWQCMAQHFGHTIADRIYGSGAEAFDLQGKQWSSTFGNSSNLKYLEEFDPRIGAPDDYFNWIPVGLIKDLMDTGEPFSLTGVVDNVSGFTYPEIQSALFNKPSTLTEFKDYLKVIKPVQAIQIDQLFLSYGY